MEKSEFGRLPDGRAVPRYTFTTDSGMTAHTIDFGAILVSLSVPDRDGRFRDVVLGYDSLKRYRKDGHCFGATVGRFANRIAGARFTLDGIEYRLPAVKGGYALHGGKKAFHKVLWKGEPFQNRTGIGVKFTYLSKDMEDGYPGNLHAEVTYTFTDDFCFMIDYRAVSDTRTHVNLTHHSYFNLNGMERDVLGHHIRINAREITETGKFGIPTGALRSVSGTPFDLTSPTVVGDVVSQAGKKGFDVNYVLDKDPSSLVLAADAFDPASGITLETRTTEPGLQFYTGNYLKRVKGKRKVRYHRHWGLCLEPQHFPNSPNHPEFPSTILDPGMTFVSETVYRFGVKK
ncbi:MAG TPA: galactose mutarotase [Spirochaetia bacterium]|nr:galactose mutarotase [Spirochaetia bacterium]